MGCLALTACTSQESAAQPSASSSEAPVVVVGMGPTEQSRVVAQTWAVALEDAGFRVDVQEIDGGRAGYLKAVEDGQIHVYPDYTGDLYVELRGTDPTQSATPGPSATTAEPTSTPGTAEELVGSLANLLGRGEQGVTDSDVESALADQLPEGVSMLDPAPADNKRVLVVTAATQAEISVNSMEDLADHCQDLTFGVLRHEGQAAVTAAAVEDIYDCNPGTVQEYDSQEQVTQALVEGEVDVAGMLSTAPAVADNSLTILGDDRDALIPERIVAVAGQNLPESAAEEVNGISGELDTENLVLLTRMTTSSPEYSAEEAATYWYRTVRP